MISRNDCLLLLKDISDNGVDTNEVTRNLLRDGVTVDVVKFINENRQLDLSAFYEKVRRSYNKKKSNLYINIVKEVDNPKDVLTTLSAFLNQVLLYSNSSAQDVQMFLRHSRASEVSAVLGNYFNTYDIVPCIKLLRIIKTDLKALESAKNEKIAS